MAHGGPRKGSGRKKGSVGGNTIEASKAKEALIAAYIKNQTKINKALIDKAVQGDMLAIKELHDRVWGKAPQTIAGDPDRPLQMVFDPAFTPVKK